MSFNEAIELFHRVSHPSNEHSKLTEEQLNKYEGWKTQPGMAQIKLEYVLFFWNLKLFKDLFSIEKGLSILIMKFD